jgi:hypothetical protein
MADQQCSRALHCWPTIGAWHPADRISPCGQTNSRNGCLAAVSRANAVLSFLEFWETRYDS